MPDAVAKVAVLLAPELPASAFAQSILASMRLFPGRPRRLDFAADETIPQALPFLPDKDPQCRLVFSRKTIADIADDESFVGAVLVRRYATPYSKHELDARYVPFSMQGPFRHGEHVYTIDHLRRVGPAYTVAQ